MYGCRQIQLVGSTAQQSPTEVQERTIHTVPVLLGTPGTPTSEPVRSTVRMTSMLMSLPQTILQQHSAIATAYKNSFLIRALDAVKLIVPTNKLVIRLESR
jgi:uncharacterized protein (DUF1499 family)